MKKFNQINTLKVASTATLLLFTTPVALNGITLTPSVLAQDVKTPASDQNQKQNQNQNLPKPSTSKSLKSKQSSSDDDSPTINRSSFMSGFWWFWAGRFIGFRQPVTSSYFMNHGGKYNESKMSAKQLERLNAKHGKPYISIPDKQERKSATTEKPNSNKSNKSNNKSNKSNNKSNKSNKSNNKSNKSNYKSNNKSKSSLHGGIGGHNSGYHKSYGG